MKNFGLKEIIVIIIGVKISIFLIIIIASLLLPFNQRFYQANFVYPPNEKVSLATSFKTWDAQHYLFLAENGYRQNSVSNAFYPLYPLLIKIVSSVIGNSFISALLISNILSFVAVLLFYRLTKFIYDSKVAMWSTLFLLGFPTAFYLGLIYTESLFLFLSMLFFTYLYKKKYFIASLISFFLPLTRVVGVLILVPLFVKILTDKTIKPFFIKIPSFNRDFLVRIQYRYFLLLIPILGFGMYLFILYLGTNDPFNGITSGEYFVGRYSIGNLLNPLEIIQTFFVKDLTLHNFTQSIIDRSLFVFYLALLPFIYKYLPKPFFFYSLIGLTPFLGSFMGYTRYVFTVFPMFMVLGYILEKKKFGFLLLPLLIFFIFLQVAFVMLYALNFWVS